MVIRNHQHIILLFLLLLVFAGCKNKRSTAYTAIDPPTGPANPVTAGEAKIRELPEGLQILPDSLEVRQILPKSGKEPGDLDFEVVKGEELFSGEQLYLFLRPPAKPGTGRFMEMTYYFPFDFAPPQFEDRHKSQKTADRVRMTGTFRDSTGKILHEFQLKTPISGGDSTYHFSTREYLDYTQFRDFSAGPQDLLLSLEANLVTFMGDFSTKKFLETEIRFSDSLPQLVVTRFHFDEFMLTDRAYNQDWDAFLANDAPDLYWKLVVGNKTAWSSSVKRNSQRFAREKTFEVYHFDLMEPVEIRILDDDVLNRSDYVDSWRGTIGELESETWLELPMESCQYFRIRAEHLGEYKP